MDINAKYLLMRYCLAENMTVVENVGACKIPDSGGRGRISVGA